ncbi:MAG: hypothetical protein F6K10_43275 [Moorea sp. SIO2B7]|nr:hypothetical protein [Moorena sp. SIO2B7]
MSQILSAKPSRMMMSIRKTLVELEQEAHNSNSFLVEVGVLLCAYL